MDNKSKYDGEERRVCSYHSGVDTRLTIFNWLLGILIVALLGGTTTIAAMLQSVNTGMSEINVKFAELRSEKTLNESTHQRIYDRIAELERKSRDK